jgi:hypothetical protein
VLRSSAAAVEESDRPAQPDPADGVDDPEAEQTIRDLLIQESTLWGSPVDGLDPLE